MCASGMVITARFARLSCRTCNGGIDRGLLGLGLLCLSHPTLAGRLGTSRSCRFCCKSLFALVIKISFGCTRDFSVKMWGTSSPEDKLAGDLGNVIEAPLTCGRRSDFFTAEKLAAGNLGLLQQYLPGPDSCTATNERASAAQHCVELNAQMPSGLKYSLSFPFRRADNATPCLMLIGECKSIRRDHTVSGGRSQPLADALRERLPHPIRRERNATNAHASCIEDGVRKLAGGPI